jgi:hypothetical protein
MAMVGPGGCRLSLDDGRPYPGAQATLANFQRLERVGGDAARRSLAGDPLCINLDLSRSNLPAGQRLAIGGAIPHVTDPPHNSCAKFAARYGPDAMKFVNSADGKDLRLRGMAGRSGRFDRRG